MLKDEMKSVKLLPLEPENEKLIVVGEHFRKHTLSMISHAVSEILLDYYIFAPDEFGYEILDALFDAIKRGVRVSLILDGFGSSDLLQKEFNTISSSAIQLCVYHPMPWTAGYLNHFWVKSSLWLTYFTTLNRRNHQKLLVVDRKEAILGSHNIWNNSLEWTEISLVFREDDIDKVLDAFWRAWGKCIPAYNLKNKIQKVLGNHGTALLNKKENSSTGLYQTKILDNTTQYLKRKRNKTILELIRNAKSRLWITTPYLYPQKKILESLKSSAQKGVDVKVLVPEKTDLKFMKWISHTLYKDMLSAGIGIYSFNSSCTLHAKVMVVDNQYLIGSGNFNHRSYFQDLEIDFLGCHSMTMTDLVEWSKKAFGEASQITTIEQIRFPSLKYLLARTLAPFKNNF